MTLEILAPTEVFALERGVRRIVVETVTGSLGLLPRRLDCVAALVAGILTYEDAAGREVHVAVDEGVLVKCGADVHVSVRRAIGGADLGQLRAAVEKEFRTVNENEANVRSVMAKLEAGVVRRFVGLRHD